MQIDKIAGIVAYAVYAITVSMCAMAVFSVCGLTAIVLAFFFRLAHPGPAFYGQIVDLSGHPIAGARIRIDAHWTDTWTDGPSGFTKPVELFSEADGRFTLPKTYETVNIKSITKGTQLWRGDSQTRFAMPHAKAAGTVPTDTTYDRPMRFTLDTGFVYYSSAD